MSPDYATLRSEWHLVLKTARRPAQAKIIRERYRRIERLLTSMPSSVCVLGACGLVLGPLYVLVTLDVDGLLAGLRQLVGLTPAAY